MKKFFTEFKKFITRGNVMDMAVGVIVGGAFTAIVNGLSNFILKPLINFSLFKAFGADSLSDLYTFLNRVDKTQEILADDGTVVGTEITVNDMITEKVAKIGEKITVRRFARYEGGENGYVDSYIHMGGKVGVMVELSFAEKNDALVEVAHDIALQIAAASPVAPEYVRRSEVRADHLEHEKEILAAQARNEGKPEKIIEKMVMGRVQKFYKEVCLLEQPFVKDPDTTVEKMIAANAKGADVVRFVRYKMGEGLEKRVDDLAAEVAAQTAGIK